jgi:hypothetical protein
MLGGLSFIVVQQCNQQHCYTRNNRLLLTSPVCLEIAREQTCVCIWVWTPFGWKTKFISGNCERGTWVFTMDGGDSRSSGLMQVSDGLYAEVLLWCASGPVAQRVFGSFLTARMGVSVPRPYRLDVYVCSKSCWLCLTVVCWLLECSKVPSWIEIPEYVTIFYLLPIFCSK